MSIKDDYKRACVALAICHQMLNDANDKIDALKEENETLAEKITELLSVKHGLEFDYSEQQKALIELHKSLKRMFEIFTHKIEPEIENLKNKAAERLLLYRDNEFDDFFSLLYLLKTMISVEIEEF